MAIIHMESSRKPTNFTRDSFHKLSALSNYRRHLHKMALTCLDLTLIVTEFLSQILCKLESRRYPTIGVNQLSASLTKDGVYPLGLNSGIDRIFLVNSLPNHPNINPKITSNVKLNYQASINCWFYFIFGVFVYKMAIIHLESSRN